MNLDAKRKQLQDAAAGTLPLQLAFIGLVDGLMDALAAEGPLDAEGLAEATGTDATYVGKWLEAAYGAELVEESDAGKTRFELSELGAAFLPDAEQTMMPLAIQSVLSARLSDRLADLMRSGDRPGEAILGEFDNVKPWFGRMLEAKFGPFFRQNVLPTLEVFAEIDASGGRVVDLGCGNGWYLRELAKNYDALSGLGIDAMEPSIRQAGQAARRQGLEGRLEFREADIFEFRPDAPFEAVVLNRTLHHLWGRREALLATIDACLADDGRLVVWEPAFPAEREELRNPRKTMLGMRNLAEHAMGNRLLEPGEVRTYLEELGLEVEVHAIDEVETVFVGRR